MDVDEPRRNDVFDRELRRALAAEGGAAAGPHVDAELAAAWMDRQLDPVAARSIEAHLAGCQECQILMATLARTAPAAPAAGELAWWHRVRAGWLVPATVAAAAALVIWVAVPQQRRAASTPAEQLQARADRSVETAPPTAGAVPAPAPFIEAAPAVVPGPQANLSRRVAQPAPETANELEKKEVDTAADAAAAAPLERRERFADAAPPAPAAPPPPPAPAQAKALQESVTIAGESAARENARQDAAIPNAQRSLAAAAGAVSADRLQSALVIAAPDGARWRRTEAAFEFAPRGGAFTATTMPVAADTITAGAAPGGTVCWLAGTDGVVLVSVDGARFTRVAAPPAANLIAIAAADARSAIVTAADGRRFRTTDAGSTWAGVP